MAKNAEAFIDALGLNKVDILGFSIGGMVAQQITLDRPELVRKLIPVLITITDPLNQVTTITYKPTGLIETIKDFQNNITTFDYDPRGNRNCVKDALGRITTFEYDLGDRLKEINYPDTSFTEFGYDYRDTAEDT